MLRASMTLAATLALLAALPGAANAGGASAGLAPRIEPAGSSPAPLITPHGAHSTAADTSLNWSGYSATGGAYTSVTATWTQPAVTARSKETYAAFWVGLDGDGSDTVEQIGTMGYTYGGRSYYTAWYEMYPDEMKEISLTVEPGDVVTATVRWLGSASYALELENQTSGRSFTTTQISSSAERASAEVIAEAPSDSVGVLPLATFGLVDFSACAVDGQTLSAVGAASIDMVDSGGDVIAATSALDAAGDGFTVSDDFTAPTVTPSGLQSSATSGWKKTPVTVKLTATDTGGSGVAAVYYTLDGGATQRYSGTFTVSDAGSHAVRYWALDAAGNASTAKKRYVNLDLARPVSTPSAVSVGRSAATRGSLIKIPVALRDAAPSSGTVTLLTKVTTRGGKTLARATRTDVAANGKATVRVRLTAALKRGTYTLRTVATDAAGNVQRSSGTARLTVR
jgi:hypothetical protein